MRNSLVLSWRLGLTLNANMTTTPDAVDFVFGLHKKDIVVSDEITAFLADQGVVRMLLLLLPL